MGALGTVVLAQPLLGICYQMQLLFGCSIERQLIGHKRARGKALLLERLANELLSSCFALVDLKLDVQDLALAVDRLPPISLP